LYTVHFPAFTTPTLIPPHTTPQPCQDISSFSMVYCGKPSGGCHACRERKTKCDQIPEGCTQCKRAKRECPGYRVPGDLIFRNESSNVIRKIKAKEAKAKSASPKPHTPPSFHSDADDVQSELFVDVVRQEDDALSIFSLAPTIEDRATGFFVTNYVIGADGPSRGHLDYFADIARSQALGDGLIECVKAVGLAGYAHSVHAPSLLKNARYQYVRALQSTNKALKDPAEVRKDTTLLSIMILGIFETITGCNQRSLKDWAEHLNGASAVIKLRGPDQIKTPAGRRMLLQVSSNLLIACINRGIPLPKHIREYMEAAMKFVQKPDSAFHVLDTMMKLASFRAECLNGKLKDRHEILSKALKLDGIMLSIASAVPPGWEYETVYLGEDSKYVYKGCYHIYYDVWMAQIWNALRTIRILLNETIRDVLLEGFALKPPVFSGSEHTAQFQISTDTLYELQADILYSVPQHMGIFPERGESGSLIQQVGGVYGRMSGGWFLLWPLWLAGVMDISTEEVRDYALLNLGNIGDVMGIKQAYVLAELLRAKQEVAVWKEPGDRTASEQEGG